MNSLLTHTFIELFYYGGNGFIINEQTFDTVRKKLLFEKYGVFDGCDEIASKLARMTVNLSPSKNIELDKCGLDFIDNIKVCIKNNISSHAKYVPSDTLVDNDGHFKSITLIINSKCRDDYYTLYTDFIHELTHAKEDYDLRQNNSSLESEVKKIGYSKHALIGNQTDNIERNVSNLLYYLNQYEKGTFVAMLKGEIERIGNKTFDDIGTAISYLKTTGPYKTYENIKKIADYYGNMNLTDDSKQLVLHTANAISDYNFKTFKDFSKWITKRAKKVLMKMENIIPKMACEYLKIKGSMAPAHYLSDDDIQLTNLKTKS